MSSGFSMSIDCSLNHDQRGDKGFLLAAVDQFGTAGPGGSQLKVLKAFAHGCWEFWFIGIPGGSFEKGSWG